MSFEERLDAVARGRIEAKRAEIERLLAQNVGRLRRASELRPHVKPESPGTNLRDLFANWTREETEHGVSLHTVHTVPVQSNGRPGHPRGYSFQPSPSHIPFRTNRLAEVARLVAPNEPFESIGITDLAFVDLETTGLSGASGTYPILIGFGFFQKSITPEDTESTEEKLDFVCEQYFLEDYCHEPAILHRVAERLKQFRGLVTYNGKAFDVPMLRGRYLMNRMRVDLDLPHIDLLHGARRIYRSRIGGCSLSAIEQNVLRLGRSHDIDGSLIPRIYFDYLQGRWPERLLPVFDHNAQDVISMGALLLLIMECVDAPDHSAHVDARDLLSLGRLHLARGSDGTMACDFLERAATASREPEITNQALRELARVYKRDGRLDEAAEIWQQECRRTNAAHNAQPFIELAKIYEHHMRRAEDALSIVKEAEAQLPGGSSPWQTEVAADLAKRRSRLEGRVAREAQRKQRQNRRRE